MALEIPKAVQDQIDFLKSTVEKLMGKVDSQTVQGVQQENEQRLHGIRMKSLFQGLGEQPPGKVGVGKYPFALYKKSTRMVPRLNEKGAPILDANGAVVLTPELDVRGDPKVDHVHVRSDDEMATKLADGWFVNPAGVPEGKR